MAGPVNDMIIHLELAIFHDQHLCLYLTLFKPIQIFTSKKRQALNNNSVAMATLQGTDDQNLYFLDVPCKDSKSLKVSFFCC